MERRSQRCSRFLWWRWPLLNAFGFLLYFRWTLINIKNIWTECRVSQTNHSCVFLQYMLTYMDFINMLPAAESLKKALAQRMKKNNWKKKHVFKMRMREICFFAIRLNVLQKGESVVVHSTRTRLETPGGTSVDMGLRWLFRLSKRKI